MKKLAYPCLCGGKIEWKKDKVVYKGVDCGVLDIMFCRKCGEEYLPEKSMKIVEEKLEKLDSEEKESVLTMLASEEVLKKTWNNPSDERWNDV